MKKTILLILTIIIYNLSFAEKIPIPKLKSPVLDLTNTLTNSEFRNIKNIIFLFENSNTAQIAVLLILTTGEETIEEYSLRVAEKWKIGSKENDDGIILIIAKNDRKLRIEVGYGLESIITDAEASYIIEKLITPQFKKGNFYIGINNGLSRIIGLITGISPNVSQLEEKNKHSESFWDILAVILGVLSILGSFVPWFLIKKSIKTMSITLLILLSASIITGFLMQGEDSFLIAALVGALTTIPFLINLIGTLTGKKGNWSSSNSWSSSSSSSSWSSSSSSSSYSGGGGSFGGGGASGSW